jgi:hypothetical protein
METGPTMTNLLELLALLSVVAAAVWWMNR